ncbi:MAG: M36 family metallopeptidase, partial [Acidobacteriota bacterium]|nr:M36 family metallopeptidase [Acidobacteriota bacterium]
GNGGLGGDNVNADAQDGSGTNNANFLTTPDGNPSSRMQMFIWTNPFGQLVTVNAPPPIVDSYIANPSNNGGTGNGLTADLAIVDDGVPPTTDSCEPAVNDLTGKIALIVWNEGACNSSVFVLNAANAGAVAAIIVDNTDEPFTNFGGSPAIPSVAVGLPDGQLFIDTIEGGDTVNATLEDNPAGQINRDSDLDNGVIAHEYGHGISNRLTGGPANVGCLNHAEQAGEGWSDWWALSLFPVASDTETTIRGIGNYVTFRPIDGVGIRNFPYTTDLLVNPQTYADIGTTNVPHGVGEIWAAMLWEMYWNLVHRYGFDEDLYTGTGGNNVAIQLVIDGMKLQPCTPTFVDARDAILAADVANNAGANECEIWNAFAKRGLGFSATAGGTGVGDETEAFDLPPGVPSVCTAIFSDGFESGDTSAWSATIP